MTNFKNWTDYYHRVNLIFHAIVAFTLLPFVLLFLEIDSGRITGLDMPSFVIYLVGLICGAMIFASYRLRISRMVKAVEQATLRKKLVAYRTVLILNYGLLEAASLIATVGLFVSTSYFFVIIYVLILFLFSVNRPTLDKATSDLILNKEEKAILVDRKEID